MNMHGCAKLTCRSRQASLEFRTLEKQRRSHLDELAGLERERNDYLVRLEQRHGGWRNKSGLLTGWTVNPA